MSETTRAPEAVAVAEMLADPFEPREVKFKPSMVKNNRCLAMAYVDARVIQDRLDEAVGVENWRDNYIQLPDNSVQCRLSVRINGRWITKEDVGSPSEQPDAGDRRKSAFSDALKRAAVKFGIGRYLYRLPSSWVDYDPVKKQIVSPPQLPVWALPKSQAPKAAPPKQAAAPPKLEQPKTEEQHRATLFAAKTFADLVNAWNAIPKRFQPQLAEVKDARKAALLPKPAEQPPIEPGERDADGNPILFRNDAAPGAPH